MGYSRFIEVKSWKKQDGFMGFQDIWSIYVWKRMGRVSRYLFKTSVIAYCLFEKVAVFSSE